MRFCKIVCVLFFSSITALWASGFDRLGLSLGMQRGTIEEILPMPLFSYAETNTLTAERERYISLSYTLYQVSLSDSEFPSHVLVVYLDGYAVHLVGLYADVAFQKVAWKLAHQPYKIDMYECPAQAIAAKSAKYYLFQTIFQDSSDILFNQKLTDLIFTTTHLDHINIIFHYDELMFQVLYQSLKNINFLPNTLSQLTTHTVPETPKE